MLFARVFPGDKAKMVKTFQDEGQQVAFVGLAVETLHVHGVSGHDLPAACFPVALLHRRARHAPVRTEDAAVTLFRTKYSLAVWAVPEKLASLCRHLSSALRVALRTRDD